MCVCVNVCVNICVNYICEHVYNIHKIYEYERLSVGDGSHTLIFLRVFLPPAVIIIIFIILIIIILITAFILVIIPLLRPRRSLLSPAILPPPWLCFVFGIISRLIVNCSLNLPKFRHFFKFRIQG